MSYMLLLQNMYLSRDIFTIIKKRLIYYSKLNFAIPTVAIVESKMSLHAGQAKKLLRGQIIIAKVTLERAHSVNTSPPPLPTCPTPSTGR